MMVTGINGISYRLDPTAVGSGGEGDIYHAFITKVAKVYKPGVLTQELKDKLEIMIENPPNESVLSQVAWPLDMIFDDKGQCSGFIMSELSINAELGEIYKYPSTLPISVHQKINIAQNICVVISEVHKAGYIFGDFNPRNIGLNKDTGLVSFLDTDTYHVVDPVRDCTYRCNVCAPGYAAPELLEKCSDYVAENPTASRNAYAQTPLPTFTQETDNFALAIHIFKLLMNGYTPFGGIIETSSVSQSSPGIGDAAVRRDSYCFKPGYKPQSAAIPTLNAFPQEIADLFTRAFIAGRHDPKQRPSAVDWHLALNNYLDSLVTCSHNPLHQYDSKNDTCPYCDADRRFGAVVSEKPVESSALKQTAYSPPPRTAPKQKTVLAAVQAIKNAQTLIAIGEQEPTIVYRKEMRSDIISAGSEHSIALAADGCLLAWGSNKYGQLGDGTFNRSLNPISIIENVVAVSAGAGHTLAITNDGDLWAWGNNEFGQLGDGTFEDRQSPVKVFIGVAAVSARGAHTLAITNDGILWAWGNNEFGQLGDGTFEDRNSPVKIMDNVKAIAAGNVDSSVVTNDGELLFWGTYGTTFDDGASVGQQDDMKIMDDVIAVSSGSYHTMAITSDGSLWACGWNGDGQLGDGSTEEHSSPVKIMDNVIEVSAGDIHTMAITADGVLWAWGLNKYGQLGDGTKTNRYSPIKIMDGVVAVSAGQDHTLAITDDGVLWSWGNNKAGKLGDGSTWKSLNPIDVMENMMLPFGNLNILI